MNIWENAEKYAEGKANQAITKAIADAYVEGYKAGYKDREEEIPMDLRDNKTEYVDLGLPSGTLWASDYEKSDGEYIYLPYEKAKYMNLPTQEQWDELTNFCKIFHSWDFDCNGKLTNFKATCISPNGNSITFLATGHIVVEKEDTEEAFCWLHDKSDNSKTQAIHFFSRKVWNSERVDSVNGILEMFSGYKLPVRLVR